MSEEKKLASIEEMMIEGFENRPMQAQEAVDEYIENLSEDNPGEALLLKEKLKNKQYLQQFKEAITQTSLILFLISIKASNDVNEKNRDLVNRVEELEDIISSFKIDMDRYVREFLLFARKDDKDIYKMRMFYLNSLTGEEWAGMEMADEENNEPEQKLLSLKVKSYNLILNEFKKQYEDSKIHLR